MKQTFHFFAPCPRGLESVLAEELSGLGAAALGKVDGGVAFSGDWPLMMRANLHSRVASRILWRLAERPYRSEDDLYHAARAIDWPELFQVTDTIKVQVTAIKSPLRSLDFATLRIKDAVCDVFRARTGERPSVDTVHPAMRIHAFLTDRHMQLYLDTSGEALFKRGYRQSSGEAPLRENLAAGILKLAGWAPGTPLFDPMCGSGTLLIEAALMALDIAPGRARHFAFERLLPHDPQGWQQIREAALAKERPREPLDIHGSDTEAAALHTCRSNLAAADLTACISLATADFLDRQPPFPGGVIVTNPPYGVRLDEQSSLAVLYPLLGHVLKQRYAGWRAYFFTADLRLAKLIRLSASKRTVLFNGGLECRLFEYRLVEGSNRKAAQEADPA